MRTVLLGDIVTIKGGGTPDRENPSYWGGAIPWASVKDFKSTEITRTAETITHAGLANSASNLIPAGAIIVPTRMAVGKAAINAVDVAINQDLKALLPVPAVDRRFLLHQLLAAGQDLERRATGATVKGITLDVLRELPVSLPPIEEQRRIAAILDEADALRAKRRAALAQIDEMARAIFVEMFGDPLANPRGLPLVPLGEIGSLDRGVSRHRPRNAPELLGGPYPFVQTGDVSNSDGYIRTFQATYSELGLKQSKMWPAGTLCITIAANIARVGILTFDACFPDSVVGFIPALPADAEYVRVWFSFVQQALEDSAPESTQKNINLAILRAYPVPLPKVEQREAFAARLIALQAPQDAAKRALSGTDALFASLQHRAFRGEL